MTTKNIIIFVVIAAAAWFIFFRKSAVVAKLTGSKLPPEEKIYALENYIKNDPSAVEWKEAIQARAEANNQSFNERLRMEVLWTLQKQGH